MYPNIPADFQVAIAGAAEVIDQMLEAVWKGYDALCPYAACIKGATNRVEDGLTDLLAERIRLHVNAFWPFTFDRQVPEEATRTDPHKVPTYDLAFKLNENPRVMWPFEAKVLLTDGQVAQYVSDVKLQFLTCRYAPFSSGGAMIGYLMKGNPGTCFNNIANSLGVQLTTYSSFARRDHRTSVHVRKSAHLPESPTNFCCHHLLMWLC